MNVYEVLKQIQDEYSGIENFSYILNDSHKVLLDPESIDQKVFELIQKSYKIKIITNEYQRRYSLKNPIQDYETVDGGTITPFSNDEVELLKSLDFSKIPLGVGAQVNDALWLVNKDYQCAKNAADLYLKLYKKFSKDESFARCVHYATRAVVLVSRINDKETRSKYLEQIYTDIIQRDGQDESLLSIKLIELLLEQNFPLNGKEQSLLNIIDKLLARKLPGDFALKDAVCLKAELYKKIGNSQCADNVYIKYAEYLIKKADPNDDNKKTQRDWFIAEENVKEAIKLFQNHGKADRAKESQNLLIKIQSYVIKSLGSYKYSIDVSEIVNKLKKNTIGHTTCDLIIDLIQNVGFLNKSEIRSQVLQQDNSILNLVNIELLDSKGRIIRKPSALDPDNEESVLEHMFFVARQNEMFIGNVVAAYFVTELKKHSDFNESSLDFIFNNNKIIPDGRNRIIRHGIFVGLAGDLYTSLHILAPQTENLIRHIAELCGDSPIYYDTKEKNQQASVLGTIFDGPMLNKYYDKNILFTLNGLLQQKAGSNIRNTIAHGLMEEKESNSGDNLYFVCVLLHLIAMYSPEYYSLVGK